MKCLIIIASSSACAGEVNLIRAFLRNLDVGSKEVEWVSGDDFKTQIAEDDKFNFIYLGAHADGSGFGQGEGLELDTWEDLAMAICETDCILPQGTLFLGCCHGGMKTVALKIFKQCNKIEQTCGPLGKVAGNDLTQAFQAFVNSLVRQQEEPEKAVERATEAAGYQFRCFRRQDLESEIETLRQIQKAEWRIDEVLDQQSHIKVLIGNLTLAVEDLRAAIRPSPSSDDKSQR